MHNAAGLRSHSFHIPVMGTGFTIDASLRVAKYGISSVISLVDDILIEQIRRFHCEQSGEPYQEITDQDQDARARRITAYLDLLDKLVHKQVEQLQASPFEPGSEITRYYEMLPDSPLKREYRDMLATDDTQERQRLQDRLRRLALPGTIDVNIMCKGDRDVYRHGEKLPVQFSDASAALRGYANSTLSSAIVFSAGMNPRLYGYTAEFNDFFPDQNGCYKKKIILKVSDYHSAAIQGKYLAKRGLWVSEYRVESGLNCGGHAFATKGLLLGPILDEFKHKKEQLAEELHDNYIKALVRLGRSEHPNLQPLCITVQGGIGTAEEDAMLFDCYEVDGTGWATPFLLVPEVTNVDHAHLKKLSAAKDGDIYLSDSSPFGLPFWNLRTSASEDARRKRLAENRPGSYCSKGFIMLFNKEFTEFPICMASRQYQQLKIKSLSQDNLTDEQRAAVRESVLNKSCICNDLGGGVLLKNNIDATVTPAICSGPNIVNFSKIATLEEMCGHIYGRISLLTNLRRPHMFIREIELYIDYFYSELNKYQLGLSANSSIYFTEYKDNLLAGIEYYQGFADQLKETARTAFLKALDELRHTIAAINTVPTRAAA